MLVNRRFVDLDTYIEQMQQCTISEIFEKQGEVGFRALETQAIKEIAKQKNIIVATGGGTVLRQENVEEMRRNGTIIFIDRPIDRILLDIRTEERPLIAGPDGRARLQSIHEQRYPIYRSSCNFLFDNDYDDAWQAARAVHRLVR